MIETIQQLLSLRVGWVFLLVPLVVVLISVYWATRLYQSNKELKEMEELLKKMEDDESGFLIY